MGDCAVAFKIAPTKSKTRIDRFDRCSPNLTYDRSVHHVYVTRARSVCINNLLVSRGANLYRRVPFFIVARSVDFIFEINEKERDRRTFTVISHEFIPNELFERSLTVALCLSLSRTLGRGKPIANVLDGRRSDCATRHSVARRCACAHSMHSRLPPPLRATSGCPHHAAHLYRHEQPPLFTRAVYRVLRHRHLHFARARRVARSSAPLVALSLHSRVARLRGSHASSPVTYCRRPCRALFTVPTVSYFDRVFWLVHHWTIFRSLIRVRIRMIIGRDC